MASSLNLFRVSGDNLSADSYSVFIFRQSLMRAVRDISLWSSSLKVFIPVCWFEATFLV